ncbi:MAG: hypothetical protein HY727_06895 [Candidatus Rokubacteria bacterium]|nr:hypothetical protein [Candidatus Rokubacteria bacterium]
MRRARALVDALAAVAARFGPEDRAAKLRLLGELAACPIGSAGLLLRLHEALCFLQAYPDDGEVLAHVELALGGLATRVARLGPARRERLSDSGVAGTTLDYPFGLPMARWLHRHFGSDVDVRWRSFERGEQLEEALRLLVTHAEDDAFSEGGMGWRRWLRDARGGRRLSDLGLLLELFERVPLPGAVRDVLFESLALPIEWRLRRGVSRTGAKLPWARPFFHGAGLQRTGVDFVAEVLRPLSGLRRAPRPLAESLIQAARAALATRLRELHAFAHANPDDVLVVDPGRGLRIALIGLSPAFRLPLEGYYAFLVLKNGVPVSYGGGWQLFGALELGLNIFASFRQGESALVFAQVLRAYRVTLGMRTVVIDRYQLGHENAEALRSGAFYFYDRLGFRPRDPAVLAVLAAERRKLAADPRYRSPLPVLGRLAGAETYLTLPGGSPEPETRLRSSQIAALVSRAIARGFGGDRARAVREARSRVAAALGVRRRDSWSPGERLAFERLSVVTALIPDLERWPSTDRGRLLAILRAKGGGSERRYTRLLDGHRRLQRSLEALVAGAVSAWRP